MKRSSSVSRRQLALGLQCEPKHQPAEHTYEELVQALADLLLQALGEDAADQPASEPGGGDESQDHP
jgi:hypothetical protein